MTLLRLMSVALMSGTLAFVTGCGDDEDDGGSGTAGTGGTAASGGTGGAGTGGGGSGGDATGGTGGSATGGSGTGGSGGNGTGGNATGGSGTGGSGTGGTGGTDGGGTGGTDGGGISAAETFCTDFEGTCTFGTADGGTDRFADMNECMTAFDAFTPTQLTCVVNHLGMAASDLDFHCPHAMGQSFCAP